MKVALLSDIHDNVWSLSAALATLGGAEALICCGDLCSPFVMEQLAEGFRGAIHVVFGNNDGDLYRIAERAHTHGHVRLHGALFDTATSQAQGYKILPQRRLGEQLQVLLVS